MGTPVTETYPYTAPVANQKSDVQAVPSGQEDSWVEAADMNKLLQFYTSLGRAMRTLAPTAAIAPATSALDGVVFRLQQIHAASELALANRTFTSDLNVIMAEAVESIAQGGSRAGTASSSGCFGVPAGLISLASGSFATSTLLSFNASGTLATWSEDGKFAPIGFVLDATTAYVNFNRRFLADAITVEFYNNSGVPTLRIKPGAVIGDLEINGTLTVSGAATFSNSVTIQLALTVLGAIRSNTYYSIGTKQVVSAAMHQAYSDVVSRFRLNTADGTIRSEFAYNNLVSYAFLAIHNHLGTLVETFLIKGGLSGTEAALGGAIHTGDLLALYGNVNLRAGGRYYLEDWIMRSFFSGSFTTPTMASGATVSGHIQLSGKDMANLQYLKFTPNVTCATFAFFMFEDALQTTTAYSIEGITSSASAPVEEVDGHPSLMHLDARDGKLYYKVVNSQSVSMALQVKYRGVAETIGE